MLSDDHQQSGFGVVPIITIIAVVAVLGFVGFRLLTTQSSKSTATSSGANNLTRPASSQPSATPAQAQSFTYTPKVGGFTLTLPKTYGVIVNVDGNKGGAPGATFKIATVRTANIFDDRTYPNQDVQVDMDDTYTNSTLEKEAAYAKVRLKSQGYASFIEHDVTVAGLPAKFIAATDQVPFRPQLYIVGAGDFVYTITSPYSPEDSANSIVADVLKGLHIKPVTL